MGVGLDHTTQGEAAWFPIVWQNTATLKIIKGGKLSTKEVNKKLFEPGPGE